MPLPRPLQSRISRAIRCRENIRLWVPLYGFVFNNSFSLVIVSFTSAFCHSWENSEGVAGTIVIRRMWEQFTSKWIKASWINSSNYSTAARGRKAIVVFAFKALRQSTICLFRMFNRLKWVEQQQQKNPNNHFHRRSLTILGEDFSCSLTFKFRLDRFIGLFFTGFVT